MIGVFLGKMEKTVDIVGFVYIQSLSTEAL